MSNYRQLAPGAYAVAFLLFVIPFFDATLSTAPFRLANAQWRFATLGLLSNALMVPATGALIAVVTAVTMGHRRTQRVLAILSWLVVALVAVAIVLFALDSVQSRLMIRPTMKLSFYVASVTALVKFFLGGLAFAFLARGCRSDRGWRQEASSASAQMSNKRMVS